MTASLKENLETLVLFDLKLVFVLKKQLLLLFIIFMNQLVLFGLSAYAVKK